EPTLRESALWVTGYILLAVAFGLLISAGYGVAEGGKFFAGWLTEYSLSVDNLLVFMVIMAQFAVPRQYHQKALMIGIVLVMVALGTTDLVFALDSIPAIFGLTRAAFLVFTANVFALMGLRQLYFLLGGLLSRLVYLSAGLSVVLGFIGVKLIMEALRENELPFLNGGEHIDAVPAIPIWLSLAVIIGTLTVATIASLAKSARAGVK